MKKNDSKINIIDEKISNISYQICEELSVITSLDIHPKLIC
jgi:hypothetical protein